MNKMIRVQILNDTVCISHSAYSLGKGMNLIILPPGKSLDRVGSLTLL